MFVLPTIREFLFRATVPFMAKIKRGAASSDAMNPPSFQVRCCVCDDLVEPKDPDGYSLQLRKFRIDTPETVWAHGVCLRRVMPVVGIAIPGSPSR
jgi:hypothetical protein